MQEKKPLNVAIGRRIQQARERARLTQEELAERIDRSTQFVSTVERGLAGRPWRPPSRSATRWGSQRTRSSAGGRLCRRRTP